MLNHQALKKGFGLKASYWQGAGKVTPNRACVQKQRNPAKTYDCSTTMESPRRLDTSANAIARSMLETLDAMRIQGREGFEICLILR